MNSSIFERKKGADWKAFDQIRITYTYEKKFETISYVDNRHKDLIWKRQRLYVHLILLLFLFLFFLEMLRNVQTYEENADSFDAIVVDPRRDQIIIGAK